MDSLTGKLLVASQNLADSHFGRTVILLIHHDSEGAFGLVINRRSSVHLEDIWERISTGPCPHKLPVMVGGPVEGPLVVLHADASQGEVELAPGIQFTARHDLVETLLTQASKPLKAIIASSGWSAGQLERELAEGSWGIADATTDYVFGDDENLWQRVTRRLADQNLARSLGIKHVPLRPWHN